MSKTILIFSDGTGQLGGLKPDQRLSNIYTMYRATRPGPDSPIDPAKQVAFYDPGLGSGESRRFTLRWVRSILSAGVGTGIDQNVIDCYVAILANYQPGDRICLFGFSRGAYTVRALANVLNLCGVPTHGADEGPLPRYGPPLLAIAQEAVRKVYNHGAGKLRSAYEEEREVLASRFRTRYGSEGVGADGEGQGNVQPYFVGVFDTVAALQSRAASLVVLLALALAIGVAVLVDGLGAPMWLTVIAAIPALYLIYRFVRAFFPVKFFLNDTALTRTWWDPRRWVSGLWHSHIAWWTGKYYDRYVDREIAYLRHAQSIDEDRFRFPRVGWGLSADVTWNEQRGKMDWLIPMWFAGNHSDIGGSYPEEESRLSDIALEWMIDEVGAALGTSVTILRERLVTSPDPAGLQHSERLAVLDAQPRWLRLLTGSRLTWKKAVREINPQAPLHQSVIDRLAAAHVPQMSEVKPYRPENLRMHSLAKGYFRKD
jgi:hypothetical protein